jgi:hypothetical protein
MTTTAADKAFSQSASHSLFADIALQPYTPARVVAAQAIGMRYPNIGGDALETFNKTGIYPGALQDVLIVLWLCSLSDDKDVTRAMRSTDEALGKAITWGASVGITDTKTESWWAAYYKFIDIMTDINASTGDPQIESQEDEDESPNE